MEKKVIIHSVKQYGPTISVEGDPISVGFIPEEVEVEAVVIVDDQVKVEGTFTFKPAGFELTFDHAEQRIRELFK
ncbi:hypothetical protein M3172_08810 [Mesobacillus subterraneus]|uniref:hypothetical protein n=1 Tax=Mesobacillus subterraneus TaxID=285983 RepID=UPI00203FD005|nr:hypothetical protein [Mesobacillus subterraneus]MCM3573294.1 hypothetical protein [Mesobacillus subterraneus]